MTLTQKGTRAEAAATAKEFLQSDHEIVVNGEEVEEYDATPDSKKSERDIADLISRPRKPPPSNKDEDAEGDEGYFGATQASTEENSPINKYKEVRKYDREDDCKHTVIPDAKITKVESSSRHKVESSLSDSPERSDGNDDDYDGTGAKYNN